MLVFWIVTAILVGIVTVLLVALLIKRGKSSSASPQPVKPTFSPTVKPTIFPTVTPTISPTVKPTISPTVTPLPSFEEQVNELRRTFNNTTENLRDVGGLLANNFGIEWFESMLRHGDVTLEDTPVCAHVNRKTCTAYSYIRKDLIPMLFMFPGLESNVPCGILLDTKKIWPMITLMAVVDGDTNNRSLCTNETGGSILTRHPFHSSGADYCMYNTLHDKYGPDHKYLKGNYATYIPVIDKGVDYPTECNGDKVCMYNNSGGNINQWFMNDGTFQEYQKVSDNYPVTACAEAGYKDCYDFEEVDFKDVPADVLSQITNDGTKLENVSGYLKQSVSKSCPLCSKPYLCVFGKTADNQYAIKEEKDRVAVYIGKDGEGFPKIVTDSWFLGGIAIKQCRFERDDWNLWVKVLRDWYKQILTILNSDNSMSKKYDYLLANPHNPSYFENEVNLYINPNTNSDEYKKQLSIWQDAIVGFYYTGTYCESQLAPLEGIVSSTGRKADGTLTDREYRGAIDRCDDFYGMTTDKRRQWEAIHIEQERELVHQVTRMFNAKHNKNVPVFLCKADSNAFPNYNSIQKALNEKVTFDDIFVLDTEYSKF